MVTTRWVLAEVADALCAGHWHVRAGAFLRFVQSNAAFTVIGESDRLFDAGLALFQDRADKNWSLTDCISFVVMSDEGLHEALTADRHFEQAGFAALLV